MKIKLTIILMLVISASLSGCIGGGGSGSSPNKLVGVSESSSNQFVEGNLSNSLSNEPDNEIKLASLDSMVEYYAPVSTDEESNKEISYYSDSSIEQQDDQSSHHNPEPASLALLGAGLFSLLGLRLRRKNKPL